MFKKKPRLEAGSPSRTGESQESKTTKATAGKKGLSALLPKGSSAPAATAAPAERVAPKALQVPERAAAPKAAEKAPPKVEVPKSEAPKAEAPKAEAPKAEAPKAEPRAAALPAPREVSPDLVALGEKLAKAVERLEGQISILAPEGKASSKDSGGAMDEVTASFRRALAEALDRKIEEVLVPLVGLYQTLSAELEVLREETKGPKRSEMEGVLSGAVAELDGILRNLGGDFIAPQVGEYYDPLIHLAVGEAASSPRGGGENVVAEVVRPGYKSGRGRVVLPARVLVERR